MMRRPFTLSLAFVGMYIVAPAASAQVIAPLPSAVTLRINGPASHLIGVLYQQSVDSVWLRPRGSDQATRGIAVSQIMTVEQAQPAYAKSLIVGTVIGIAVGAALYPITSHNDHDVFVGLSVLTGAVAGMMFPHIDWVPVPLR